MRKIAIYYNDDYSRGWSFSSRRKSLQDLHDRVVDLSGEVILLKPLRFSGKDVADVRANVMRQLSHDLDIHRDMARITFFGDGGTRVFLHAMQQIIKVKNKQRYPIFIAPGGTMNLLSGHVNKQQGRALVRYLKAFDDEQDITRVHIRNLSLIRERTSFHSQSEDYPWVCFAGGGMDAYLLNIFESLPRNYSVPWKVTKTAQEVFIDVIRHGHEMSCHGAVALPTWGIIKFPERYDSLSKDYFHCVTMKPRRGVEAVLDTFACNLAGLHPEILNVLWQELPPESTGVRLVDDMLNAAYSMQPQVASEWTTPIPTINNKVFFHVDGFPMQSEVASDEKVSLQFSTPAGESIPVFTLRR